MLHSLNRALMNHLTGAAAAAKAPTRDAKSTFEEFNYFAINFKRERWWQQTCPSRPSSISFYIHSLPAIKVSPASPLFIAFRQVLLVSLSQLHSLTTLCAVLEEKNIIIII